MPPEVRQVVLYALRHTMATVALVRSGVPPGADGRSVWSGRAWGLQGCPERLATEHLMN